jgi:16S rRNA (cytidine1402-2'-O)-methyltransferase
MKNSGILYICPTPIGNLEDITFRAIRILKEVDLIACEDTRVTGKLLNHYKISTKLVSYHKFSEKKKSEYLINLLLEGKNIALVSDAGTPLISDPGSELVKSAGKNNIRIIPLPGASALTTALCAVYRESTGFIFAGFLPKSAGDKKEFLLKHASEDIVFYESPNRIVKTLDEILKILGNRTVSVARELTKIYEEIKTGSCEELIEYYSNNPAKGEIVAIVRGCKLKNYTAEQEDIVDKIRLLKKERFSTKDISSILSALTGIKKSEIYDMAKNIN